MLFMRCLMIMAPFWYGLMLLILKLILSLVWLGGMDLLTAIILNVKVYGQIDRGQKVD